MEWDKGGVINYKNKSFPIEAAAYDIERGQLAEIRFPLWQTDTAVAKNSWGYTENNDYKTVNSLVEDLIDIVSKNGVLLLNIGPKPDGTIPQEEVEILLAVGEWLAVNGEAIYDTRPWKVFGEGPSVDLQDDDTVEGDRDAYTAEDIRFTTTGESLYAICLGEPVDGRVVIRSLGPAAEERVKDVSLLGAERAVDWSQEADGLVVTLPGGFAPEMPFTLKLHQL